MPTTYAHYSFGQKVRQTVGERESKVIEKYPELYNFGVHGPDLLFYFNALSKNSVNQLGYRLHQLPGRYFFENAARVIRMKEEREAFYAYAYGFICHFALDVYCHGYINEKIEASGISHAEIEAELDRELMVRNGLNPISQKVTGHLAPSLERACVIKEFFPNVDEKQILKTMKDMVFYLDMLTAPSKTKRGMILTLLKASGHYESMHGLIINYEKNPLCEDSTKKLLLLYGEAVESAARLIEEFRACVEEQVLLQDIYLYNFNSQRLEGEEAQE